MAIGIIDAFEMIQVYKDESARAAGTLTARQFFIEPAHDGAVIGQAGDGIGDSGPGLFSIELIQFQYHHLLLIVGFLQLRAQHHLAIIERLLFAQQGVGSWDFTGDQANQERNYRNAQNKYSPVTIGN